MPKSAFISTFDPTNKKFAFVSADNRIKVWSIDSGSLDKELKEPKHLLVRYSCITFWSGSTSKKESNKLTSLVALGTEKGAVVVWDDSKGEVIHIFDEKKGIFHFLYS
jgi:WD40 repeat protein